jgi:hypothetical protein
MQIDSKWVWKFNLSQMMVVSQIVVNDCTCMAPFCGRFKRQTSVVAFLHSPQMNSGKSLYVRARRGDAQRNELGDRPRLVKPSLEPSTADFVWKEKVISFCVVRDGHIFCISYSGVPGSKLEVAGDFLFPRSWLQGFVMIRPHSFRERCTSSKLPLYSRCYI